jgi:hypothetical protein
VSWDQHASQAVLEKWVNRALDTESISGIGHTDSKNPNCFVYTHPESVSALRDAFVRERVDKIDSLFGRTLGCRMNPVLKQYVNHENHIKKRMNLERERLEKEERKKKAAEEAELAAASEAAVL